MPKASPRKATPRTRAVPPPATAGTPAKKTASLFSVPHVLPDDFVASIQRLEKALGMDVLLFVHLGGPKGLNFIHPGIWYNFATKKSELCKRKGKTALLVDSPGGDAEAAYRIARLLHRQCGGFTAIVPRWAKSAATLMALGAKEIILGEEADLGPLDAQYRDYDVEENVVSALDTVQAVVQLEENANDLAITVLENLQRATNKKYNTLIRQALHFAADVTRPLFQSVDAVKYTRQARVLEEAQVYAERLLRQRFPKKESAAIAEALVRNYPCHGFVIDIEEARHIAFITDDRGGEKELALQVSPPPSDDVRKELDWLFGNMNKVVAFGYLVDAPKVGGSP